MPDKEGVTNEFDGPWKVALEIYLRPFLELCFPDVHALIDWRHRPEFLDTELQAVGPAHEQAVLAVDRLVKVRMRTGRFEWLFIHVEVQAQRRRNFSLRMFEYYYRIRDKFGERVISLGVLGDNAPTWRPSVYEIAMAGLRLRFEYPVFKVIDFPDPEGAYRKTGNPFALVIAAHQLALSTARNSSARYRRRLDLMSHLCARGMDKNQARELWKVIQVITQLPEDLELKFRAEAATVQPMSIKDLITPLERIAMREGEARGEARGEAKGTARAILEALEARFGSVPPAIARHLEAIPARETLLHLLRLAVTEPSLDSFAAKVKEL